MDLLVILVFLATYGGMALGRVPGLRVDRTGIALLAVTVLLAFGAIGLTDIGKATDLPTLLLLFALMLLSGQFAAGGFYDALAGRIAAAKLTPKALLGLTIACSGLLSAVLVNDIVVFSMTPLLCRGLAARGLDPRPYLIGLAAASNAGSAATLIGNPQNILIGQLGGLDFWQFLAVCGVPALVALVLVYWVTAFVWKADLQPGMAEPPMAPPAFDRWQTAKAALATLLLLGLFATPVPREVAALMVAGLLLVSRKTESRALIGAVDWPLLLLFTCLFTVTAAFSRLGMGAGAMEYLAARDLMPETLSVMAPLMLLVSNTIGNVPGVVLITAVWPAADPGALYGLALLSTLAGNFLIVGSLANIIVAERASAAGYRLGFRDFARAGVPITLASMAFAVGWLWMTGWMTLV